MSINTGIACNSDASSFPFPRVSMEAVCGCGAALWRVVWVSSREWGWADTTGQTHVRIGPTATFEPGLYESDPSAWWARILEVSPGDYSVWSSEASGAGAYWMARNTHIHYPSSEAPCASEVPWCHDEPMQATPRGWRCRETGHVEPYSDQK